MRSHSLYTAAVVLAFGLGACSDDEGSEDRANRTTDTTLSPGSVELTPEGRELLRDSEQLAGEVEKTARAYAAGDIERPTATARLERARDRAAQLADRAESLPEAERGREELRELNQETASTADEVTRAVGAERRPDLEQVEELTESLRETARSTFDRFRGDLDSRAREAIEQAWDGREAEGEPTASVPDATGMAGASAGACGGPAIC